MSKHQVELQPVNITNHTSIILSIDFILKHTTI